LFEIKQHICYPGDPKKPNEDMVAFGKDYCFALDGASCLSGVDVMGRGSDAAWLVENVTVPLRNALEVGDDRPTGQILSEILPPLRRQYFATLEEKGIPEPEDSPSAGLALFRKRNGQLEFFGLGDCVGVATLPGGKEFYSLDTNLPNLDCTVLDKMVLLHKQENIPVLQARSLCNDLLLANRKKRNHPDGYWVLDLSSENAIANARAFSWPLTEPVPVAAFSDGFSQLADVFRLYADYSALFAAMQTTDLENLCQRLCYAQEEDPGCDRFPRFKHRDDTCAIWGIFTP